MSAKICLLASIGIQPNASCIDARLSGEVTHLALQKNLYCYTTNHV